MTERRSERQLRDANGASWRVTILEEGVGRPPCLVFSNVQSRSRLSLRVPDEWSDPFSVSDDALLTILESASR